MKSSPALTQWLTTLTAAVGNNTLVKLTLSKPTATAGTLKSIDVRPILIKRQLMLSFTYHHKTNDIVKNFNPTETTSQLVHLLGKTFTHARLHTVEGDLHLANSPSGFTLTRHPASHTQAPALSHDQPKNRLLETTGKSYLHALGLTNAQGEVLKSAHDKFRQIHKYIEIVDGLIKPLPATQPPTIADMGAGKGYLTFALYDHLTTTLGRPATITGVEFRPDLVKQCNAIAKANNFSGLSFVEGTIESYDCTGAQVVIALHACDTATDDALAKGIKAGAQLIIVAPCCHKQIRRQMTEAAKTQPAPDLTFMLQYGTYAERMAEMVTDALRSQFLQLSGYTTNLFEFIAGEHTPKNVIITAIRNPQLPTTAEQTTLRTAIASAKAKFGLRVHQLEKLLNL